MITRFTGLFAAPHTPMNDDFSLRLEAIEPQAGLLMQQSVAGAFVAGTTGESLSLSMEERLELAKRWVDVASGTSLQIILHVGHNSLSEAQTLARQAARLGADAISAMAPCYFKPESVECLVDFCAAIAREAPDVPFFYYHIPGMTGVQLSMVEFLLKAQDRIPNLQGLKFSSLDLVQLQECLNLENRAFDVLFGCDESLLAAWALGVRGAVGSTYNFAASLYRRMIDHFERGEMESAQRQQLRSVRMVRLLLEYGFMAASKHVMSLLGVECGPVRPPLKNLTDDQRVQLTKQFEVMDVLDQSLRSVTA